MSSATRAIACLLLLFLTHVAIAQDGRALSSPQFFLFIEHDGAIGGVDHVADGASVTLSGTATQHSNAGSTDGTTGEFATTGDQPAIPTINGALALRGGRYVDIQVTNDSFENLQLNSINFDYSRMFGGAPKNVSVEYLSGDLDDAAASLFQVSDLPITGVYVDYDDYSVDLAATLSDTVLAAGESATFRISVSNASKTTTSGGLDNISIAAEEVTEEADPEFLFIEHDGITSAADFTRDGISVTLQHSARIRDAGSTDGSTGDVDVPEVIPAEVDGVHAVRPNGGHFEFTVANTNLNEIALSTIRFDYNRRYSGNPPTLEVEYAGGDLGTAPVLLARFENVPASSFVSGDFEDFAVDVRTALSDYSLAQGESATFRVSVSDGISTRAGSLDNISIDGVVPVIVDPNDLDGDGIPNDWELTHGLDPNDPSDALADPDGDLYSNLDEYLLGYDPHQFNGGDIAIVSGESNAYEKSSDSANFTITRANGIAPLNVSITADGGTNPDEAASSDDYEVVYQVNGADVVANGAVAIAEGATSVEVFIRPTSDDHIEYPENWRVTIGSSAQYNITGTTSESGKIYEATDIRSNERVYFGTFALSPGVSESDAVGGLATVIMNGTNTQARVSAQFSVNGLTSTQTASHLHLANPGDPHNLQGPHIFDIPAGEFQNAIWNLSDTHAHTGQYIIDTLNGRNGLFVYMNIHTSNNPAGEIRAILREEEVFDEWEIPADPPEIPQLTGDELTRDVIRFLTQATFGATEETIDALVASVVNDHNGDQIAAYEQWIDDQFALDQTNHYDYAYHANQEHWHLIGREGPAGYNNKNVRPHQPRLINHTGAWWTIANAAHDQLRQRIGFALGQIFVISRDDKRVETHQYGASKYVDTLIRHADGNYRDLIEEVSKSPIMGIYLSHLQNRKERQNAAGEVIISPDENYAREIMQLFSIGLLQLNPDGTLATIDKIPQVTYTNEDITELARVFTGWAFSKYTLDYKKNDYAILENNKFSRNSFFHRYISPHWEFPMKNFPNEHDFGSKIVLGSAIPADLSGDDDMGAALDILYHHDNLAPFLSRLMIQRLTHSNPSRGYIYRVAQAFENGTFNGTGSGERGDFGAMTKAILLDYEARSLELADETTYGKQKEPLLRLVQAMRALGGKSNVPVGTIVDHGYPSDQLDNFPDGVTRFNIKNITGSTGQSPLRAPSVFNWFLPDYQPPGDILTAGLNAPEMLVTNEFQVVGSNNDLYRLVFETLPGERVPESPRADSNVRIDHAHLESIYQSAPGSDADKAEALVDHLDLLLTGGRLKHSYGDSTEANPRDVIINATVETTGSRKVKTATYLIVSSPEFLHQK